MLVKCVWFLFLFHLQYTLGYIESVEVSGCESCLIFLTCRHLNSIIAILEANFEPQSVNETLPIPTVFPPIHPRQALNRRCSGATHCSFILTEDCPGADKWGYGNLTVKYVCISERRKKKYCNNEILLPSEEDALGVSEGFIHNPGYPRFYSGQMKCKWIIKAPSSQNVKITILDLSVAGKPNANEECSDHLEIKDSEQTIYTSCITEEPPAEIQSGSDTLQVILISSSTLTPRRGVLIYYTAVGCIKPAPPENGHIIFRNDTIAEISCCYGYVFRDTGLRRRNITCLGHRWDVDLSLLNCYEQSNMKPDITQELKPSSPKMTDEGGLTELIIPSLIIVALFVINFIIILVIYKYRQRHFDACTNEEMGTIALQATDNENTKP